MAIAPTAQGSVAGTEGANAAASTMPWPSEKAGFYALFCVVFATFVTFFDQTVFGMLSERMKVSFGISDATLGILQGPVTVVAYVIVGIPLARLVDIFPRKYVLGASIAILGSIMALGGLAQSFRPARRHAAVRRGGELGERTGLLFVAGRSRSARCASRWSSRCCSSATSAGPRSARSSAAS